MYSGSPSPSSVPNTTPSPFTQNTNTLNPGWVFVGIDAPAEPARLPLWKRLALPVLGALLLISAIVAPAAAASRPRTLSPRETLVEIAHDWQTTPETLRWLNKMSDTELAWGGQQFVVPPDEGMIAYTIQAGDSPQRVAVANGMTLAELLEVNKLSPSSILMPGSTLLVRSDRGLWASNEVKTYLVGEGDTVESIAELFQTDALTVYQINDLQQGASPEVGTRLLIPARDVVERLGNTPRDDNGYLQIAIEDFPTLTEKWVDVDLSHQRMTAYEGTKPVYTAYISSGKAGTPTVTGVFRIWAKISSQTMSGGSRAGGDYYNLPGVQWVAYFYKDYALHGAYWHNRFGIPTSHGCVNLTNTDAEWLYNWMSPENPGRGWYTTDKADDKGTMVVVHR